MGVRFAIQVSKRPQNHRITEHPLYAAAWMCSSGPQSQNDPPTLVKESKLVVDLQGSIPRCNTNGYDPTVRLQTLASSRQDETRISIRCVGPCTQALFSRCSSSGSPATCMDCPLLLHIPCVLCEQVPLDCITFGTSRGFSGSAPARRRSQEDEAKHPTTPTACIIRRVRRHVGTAVNLGMQRTTSKYLREHQPGHDCGSCNVMQRRPRHPRGTPLKTP